MVWMACWCIGVFCAAAKVPLEGAWRAGGLSGAAAPGLALG